MIDGFVTLFTDLNLVSLICLAIGILLIVIEIRIPGFGVFGISGLCMTIFSVVWRIIVGGENTMLHVGLLLLIAIVVIALSALIIIRNTKFDLFGNSKNFNDIILSTEYADGVNDYGYLIGRVGTVLSDLKPVGKVLIDNNEYHVLSNGRYINRGSKVKVIDVNGTEIVVKQI